MLSRPRRQLSIVGRSITPTLDTLIVHLKEKILKPLGLFLLFGIVFHFETGPTSLLLNPVLLFY